MSENPYLKRRNKNKIGKSGRKAERHLGKKLEAHQKPASGAMKGAKGDLTKEDVLIEVKSTVADSYKVEFTNLCKIKGEALADGKLPVLAVAFVNGNGRPKPDGVWYMIERSEFEEFLEYRKNYEI